MKYIDRQKVLEELESFSECSAIYIVKGIPVEDVEPVVRGHWKEAMLDHEAFGVRPTILYCSECHMCAPYRANFCPNCGARNMDGDDNEAEEGE